jgi:hypothetical protein
MDIQRVIAACLASGLRFTIELDGGAVGVKLGDYLRKQAPDVIFTTFDDAVEWLQRRCQIATT